MSRVRRGSSLFNSAPPDVDEAYIKKMNKLLQARCLEYSTLHDINACVITWNVNGRNFNDPRNNLNDFSTLFQLQDNPLADIYFITLQEIVDLNVMNVVLNSSTSDEAAQIWKEAIESTLNSLGNNEVEYKLISERHIVGLLSLVFARKSISTSITDIRSNYIYTGSSGLTGNKGGIGIRFELLDSSFCFVSAHFHANRENVLARNNDYNMIMENLTFQPNPNLNLSNKENYLNNDNNNNNNNNNNSTLINTTPSNTNNSTTMFGTPSRRGSLLDQNTESLVPSSTASPKFISENRIRRSTSVLNIYNHENIFWAGDLNYRIATTVNMSNEDIFRLLEEENEKTYEEEVEEYNKKRELIKKRKEEKNNNKNDSTSTSTSTSTNSSTTINTNTTVSLLNDSTNIINELSDETEKNLSLNSLLPPPPPPMFSPSNSPTFNNIYEIRSNRTSIEEENTDTDEDLKDDNNIDDNINIINNNNEQNLSNSTSPSPNSSLSSFSPSLYTTNSSNTLITKKRTYKYLLNHDQLLMEKKKNNIFRQFKENKILFKPTYKFIPYTNQYSSSGKKIRLPAWCDRILYLTRYNLINCSYYNKKNSLLISDHKPVVGWFNIKIREENYQEYRKIKNNLLLKQDYYTNLIIPKMQVNKLEINFHIKEYNKILSDKLIIKNLTVYNNKNNTSMNEFANRLSWCFIAKNDETNLCKDWIHIKNKEGILSADEEFEIEVVVLSSQLIKLEKNRRKNIMIKQFTPSIPSSSSPTPTPTPSSPIPSSTPNSTPSSPVPPAVPPRPTNISPIPPPLPPKPAHLQSKLINQTTNTTINHYYDDILILHVENGNDYFISVNITFDDSLLNKDLTEFEQNQEMLADDIDE